MGDSVLLGRFESEEPVAIVQRFHGQPEEILLNSNHWANVFGGFGII
jgi:hypothetical protein